MPSYSDELIEPVSKVGDSRPLSLQVGKGKHALSEHLEARHGKRRLPSSRGADASVVPAVRRQKWSIPEMPSFCRSKIGPNRASWATIYLGHLVVTSLHADYCYCREASHSLSIMAPIVLMASWCRISQSCICPSNSGSQEQSSVRFFSSPSRTERSFVRISTAPVWWKRLAISAPSLFDCLISRTVWRWVL